MASTSPAASVCRPPEPDRSSALELLASVPQEICAEALMLPHGFTGFATVTAQRVRADGQKLEVAMLRITDAGRRPLADAAP